MFVLSICPDMVECNSNPPFHRVYPESQSNLVPVQSECAPSNWSFHNKVQLDPLAYATDSMPVSKDNLLTYPIIQ